MATPTSGGARRSRGFGLKLREIMSTGRLCLGLLNRAALRRCSYAGLKGLKREVILFVTFPARSSWGGLKINNRKSTFINPLFDKSDGVYSITHTSANNHCS